MLRISVIISNWVIDEWFRIFPSSWSCSPDGQSIAFSLLVFCSLWTLYNIWDPIILELFETSASGTSMNVFSHVTPSSLYAFSSIHWDVKYRFLHETWLLPEKFWVTSRIACSPDFSSASWLSGGPYAYSTLISIIGFSLIALETVLRSQWFKVWLGS